MLPSREHLKPFPTHFFPAPDTQSSVAVAQPGKGEKYYHKGGGYFVRPHGAFRLISRSENDLY